MNITITAEDMNKVVKLLKKSSLPLVSCPRCGKKCYELAAHPEAALDLKEAGYDGSCCSPVLEQI